MARDEESLVFDRQAFELRVEGRPVDLEPQALDVLAFLLDRRDTLVTKEELLDGVWGDRFVSESALTTRIKQLRNALGDDGRAQRVIKTVHGRGYRFVGDVVESDRAESVRSQPMTEPPRPLAGASSAGALPPDRTPLIGRSDEIAAVAGLLGSSRLVTLLGIGGTGKTRLSAAVARTVAHHHEDGVVLVDLVPVAPSESIWLAIARAADLGLRAADADERVCELLADQRMLLVLDNCEHVLDEVAAVADRILGSTSGPRLLVTSREPLALVDERRFVVEPLAVDDDGGDAFALLAATAERFGVHFTTDDERAAAIRVCRGLDGLPLAIELAAAQLRHLDVRSLADRLDRRFEMLVGPRRDRRHASLLAVLEDSWALLDDDEREALGQLAVFPGPFTVDDVEGVVDHDPLSGLGALVDRSLVHRVGPRRYRVLESVRMLSSERSTGDQLASRRDRHAAWCLAVVGDDPLRHYYDIDLAEWIRDHEDDLRVAERHLVAGGRRREAADLLASTGLAMHVDDGRAASDALHRLDVHLEDPDLDEGLRCRLHATAALAAMAARAPTLIASHGHAAVAAARRAGDDRMLGLSLVLASWSTIFDDPEAALAMLDEATTVAITVGDDATRDLADSYRAWHLGVLRREEEATELARTVIARADLDTYPGFAALVALSALSAVDDPAAAAGLIARWPDHYLIMGMWGNDLIRASAAAAAGDTERAASMLLTVDGRLLRSGQSTMPDLLVPAALIAAARGENDLATRWIDAVRASPQPTQSFQATTLYRRVRARLAPLERRDSGSGPSRTSKDVADEVRTWLGAIVDGPA